MLLHSPTTVASTNGVQPTPPVITRGDTHVCQTGETLPVRTSAIRLPVLATTGPRVSLQVNEGARTITRGTRETAWYGSNVTIPVRPLLSAAYNTTVCFQLSYLTGYVGLYGTPTRPGIAATAGDKALQGRVSIAYLRPSNRSWLSRAGAVIRHMGLGRAASGTWIVLPIATLAALTFGLASWLVSRELR